MIWFPLLFSAAITVHNLEEALWLPAWSQVPSRFHKPVAKKSFYFAVSVVTILAYVSSGLYYLLPHTVLMRYCFYGFTAVMALNAVFPHLAATIAERRYCPGVASGVILMLPLGFFMVKSALEAGVVQWAWLLLSTALVGGTLLAMLPLLFRIGDSLEQADKA